MGGEYLPGYQPREVEIARLELASTTSDVISIRARSAGERIRYRILDEYESVFSLPRKTSLRPLSLLELIELIDGSSDDEWGLALTYTATNYGCLRADDLERLVDFTTVSSEVYPQLSVHYEYLREDWYQQEQAKLTAIQAAKGPASA